MTSLRMQVEKKKAQEEMRRLMAERKKKDLKPVKIDNPLAKYNSVGQLMCLLCSSVVRSEHVWQVHINSKQHRENIEQAKKLKELTKNFTVVKAKHKTPSQAEGEPPEKKVKGILKKSNVHTQSVIVPNIKNNAPQIVTFHNEEIKRTPIVHVPVSSTESIEGIYILIIH